MPILFSNTASSLLNTTIGSGDTSIELVAGFGARFPNPGAGEFFYITLEDDQGNFEVCRCTSRSNDLLTVVRGVDNTVAQAFTQNVTRVELRVVAVVMEGLLQTAGGTMTGNVDFAQNNLTDAVLNGPNTQITNGEIVGVPIRGDAGVTTNELVVPSGGGTPTVGGSNILVSGDDIVAELDVAGVITFDSATIGVVVPAAAYLRVAGATPANYGEFAHDDTTLSLSGNNTATLSVSGFSTSIELSAPVVDMLGSDLARAEFIDFTVARQLVSSSATVAIDYELGSYVELSMTSDITTFSITNVPASARFATLRLKIQQDGTGGRGVTWPVSYNWPGGNAPDISAGTANQIDFVDLWTDDGGTTWYGAFNRAWS